ncbi:hypothetical protein NQ317_001445 [Molorchus minor]|uniref:AATF leucine zipper-containing domain-containing protein n=1 Tax=Molorchus minor TaxID=1323400 RepID=A0ABQ9JLV3_9CUCU|nr:hypothetical protein NQ317_001445 [Molorchus minor]
MIKTNHKETLADKIADVLNTAPVTLDLEDDDLDNTHAKVVDADPYVEDDADEVFLSKLRRQNIDIEDDIRYKGVKANRKDIYGSSDDEQYESDEDSEDGVEEVEESEESENEDDGLEDKQNLSVEEEEASEDEYEDEMSDEGDSGDVTKKDDFKAMSKTDFSAEMKKGLCVRNQMNMWENLLETRIQLQKCLVTANKMRKRDIFIEIKQTSGNEFTDEVAKTKKSLMSALDKLLLLQKLVLKKIPQNKESRQKE